MKMSICSTFLKLPQTNIKSSLYIFLFFFSQNRRHCLIFDIESVYCCCFGSDGKQHYVNALCMYYVLRIRYPFKIKTIYKLHI